MIVKEEKSKKEEEENKIKKEKEEKKKKKALKLQTGATSPTGASQTTKSRFLNWGK